MAQSKTQRQWLETSAAGAAGIALGSITTRSTPFVEAMNKRARLDLGEQFDVPQGERTEVHEIPPPQRFSVPKPDERPTPFAIARKYPRGFTDLTLHLPYCCFPAYRHDGKPSQVRVLEPDHPIVKDVPRLFEIPQTEMYDEPFHVPEPDEVILEERWVGGEWFRSGALLVAWQRWRVLLPPRS